MSDANFTPFLQFIPEEALAFSAEKIVQLLAERFGNEAAKAFAPGFSVASPVENHLDGQWLKQSNCVGINVRTIGSFWQIIPYCMTLPVAQNSIHILPIWEPGVVSSLYGMASWNINPEFYSAQLAAVFPHLDTVEKQLKVVVNLLHLMGKTVGMDVVPHTDRYAEQVLSNPEYFEWLQRMDGQIVRHDALLWQDAAALIFSCLRQMGAAAPNMELPSDALTFFQLPEPVKLFMLFGNPEDYGGRLSRRKVFVQWLFEHGFETVPATMAPPYRGIEVDPDPAASITDDEGRVWRDYKIIQPQGMSRVFGPLARYRLYESKDNNKDWLLDFDAPVKGAWDYVCQHYQSVQAAFGFDFMRGDMSHVQMRPEGVPAQTDAYYDILGAVKQYIRQTTPWFGYFAESFMAPPDEMAYGVEEDHLEASFADTTLGDLQSEPVGTPEFIQILARYTAVAATRQFAPNFTILTADKDDPRFDRFYLAGNEARYFIALFLPALPSYMAMGFECRDRHEQPAPNEHYSKLYVFQEKQGPKATNGPYVWGQNTALYTALCRQKVFSNQIYEAISNAAFQWIIPPDGSGEHAIIAWKLAPYYFIVNLNTAQKIPVEAGELFDNHLLTTILFSTHHESPGEGKITATHIFLDPGEGIVLKYPI